LPSSTGAIGYSARAASRAGEWTTYGDMAIAVSDNIRLARTVGRVAAKNPAFANPHRIRKRNPTRADPPPAIS
jgi:O6-methylguanine-DNA--protein-cysteine methyltransferase